jgi:hypothetical protein
VKYDNPVVSAPSGICKVHFNVTLPSTHLS